ncbi:TetR/AcrR family transcriptional regulator [Sphingomonas sp.]|uniref:TetR/AcrR family transcriptional regulator n=1 Tax=Sphingomonas sp. TaxID=28214 RepID=UPI001D240B6C|nr:TetR/AcrR family transcriptional regulator [Sphingomonas sp.]MBX9796175.1 TetR/AcrR family transcriptional regulator [Sphingomonas sp.]
MPHPVGKKEEGRARLLAGAGRSFRAFGYGGVGVDGIAREAGVTSGAFYAHFPSKAAVFGEVVAVGLADLAAGIRGFREGGAGWAEQLIDFYLDERLNCDVRESCALQSLTAEAARGADDVRRGFADGFAQAVAAMTSTDGPAPLDHDRAVALLALLSGGVTIARTLPDGPARAAVARATGDAARRLLRAARDA